MAVAERKQRARAGRLGICLPRQQDDQWHIQYPRTNRLPLKRHYEFEGDVPAPEALVLRCPTRASPIAPLSSADRPSSTSVNSYFSIDAANAAGLTY